MRKTPVSIAAAVHAHLERTDLFEAPTDAEVFADIPAGPINEIVVTEDDQHSWEAWLRGDEAEVTRELED